ncbi:hypothetical protein [Pontivivens ytuae]|uniref:hypothetical protein n=1 Tax=Pontivivens ytuae TaxID=2789856 RepID=UPI001E3B1AC8|nr:hypothetical protein [Pontivivens ytuae]
MVHPAMPWVMGGAMGLMLPWVPHMEGAGGLAFVLGHVAVLLVVAALALVLPCARRLAAAHLRGGHVLRMGGAAAMGFAANCAVCLLIGGQHWT